MSANDPNNTPDAAAHGGYLQRRVRPVALPRGIYQRAGFAGTGVQLYRIVGSSLGDMEHHIGYGATLDAAIADAKARNNWPNAEPTDR